MKRGIKKTVAACCIALMLLSGCTKSAKTESADTKDTVSDLTEQEENLSDTDEDTAEDTDSMFTDRDKEVGYDENECTAIQLSDDGSSCDSQSVSIEGQTVTITEEGTYLLSGSLSDGSVVIYTDENVKVRLILNGVSINSSSSAAIYVKSADKVFITLAPDTENVLSNGGTYETVDDNNIDSVIFSKSDLTLNGSGSLKVTAKEGHGVVSKDDLVITGGTYNIEAASQGLSGKDSIRILDGDFTVTAGKDALHAENEDDKEKGVVYIAGGTFALAFSGDGISASGDMTLLDGTYTITAGGGSENGEDHQEERPGGSGGPGEPGGMLPSGERPQGEPGEKLQEESETTDEGEASETAGTKGIKANGSLAISGGTYTIYAADDGFHSNSDIAISGGTLTIASGDDGIHADGQVTVSDGTIVISESYEGIEGSEKVLIAGGRITLTSDDDGLNSAVVEISGGHTEIDAEGDGIDSNGIFTVSGGETYVSGPAGDGDGALDYETDAVITGGILIAAGSSGMTVNFGEKSTQGSILLNTGSQKAGTDIVLTDASGTELLSWQSSKSYASVVISCPEIVQGESYTIKAGTSEATVTMDSLIYGAGKSMGR